MDTKPKELRGFKGLMAIHAFQSLLITYASLLSVDKKILLNEVVKDKSLIREMLEVCSLTEQDYDFLLVHRIDKNGISLKSENLSISDILEECEKVCLEILNLNILKTKAPDFTIKVESQDKPVDDLINETIYNKEVK